MRGRGRVTEFDAHRGLGQIAGDDGARLTFHCTQIAGDDRSVPVGAAVRFDIVPGQLGAWEAATIDVVTG